MSGKQWWPAQASFYDAQKYIIDFQKKAREHHWLKSKEIPKLYHVYAIYDYIYDEHLDNINSYIQISKYDNHIKNMGRVSVIRLLSMLLKWHGALGKDKILTSPPSVFVIPNLFHKDYYYGLIAKLKPDENHLNQKNVTIIISEKNILPDDLYKLKIKWFGNHWIMPQTANSYHWLTVKTWMEEQQKESFSKWVYGSYKDKKFWLNKNIESIFSKNDENDENNEIKDNKINKLYSNLGINGFTFDIKKEDIANHNINPKIARKIEALKELGAIYHNKSKTWFLPSFWGLNEVNEWLLVAQDLSIYDKTPTPRYNK